MLQDEPSPLSPSVIAEKCSAKLVLDFQYIRSQSTYPLTKFLDYLTYPYMIDNLVLLVTGTLHERDIGELLEKCNPLGTFPAMVTGKRTKSVHRTNCLYSQRFPSYPRPKNSTARF